MDRAYVKLVRENWLKPEYKISAPDDAVRLISDEIIDLDREALVAIYVSVMGQVITTSICSIGSVSMSVISIPEILRTALLTGACGIILMHNHPSGKCDPSVDDENSTRALFKGCKAIGLTMLDHIIIGTNGSYSMRSRLPYIFDLENFDD